MWVWVTDVNQLTSYSRSVPGRPGTRDTALSQRNTPLPPSEGREGAAKRKQHDDDDDDDDGRALSLGLSMLSCTCRGMTMSAKTKWNQVPPHRLEEEAGEEKGVTDSEAKRRLTRCAGSWVLLGAGLCGVGRLGWAGLGGTGKGQAGQADRQAGWLAGCRPWEQTAGPGWLCLPRRRGRGRCCCRKTVTQANRQA